MVKKSWSKNRNIKMNIKKLKEKIEFNSLYYRQEIVLVSVGFIVGLIFDKGDQS